MDITFCPRPKSINIKQWSSKLFGIKWEFNSSLFSSELSLHTLEFAREDRNIQGRIILDNTLTGIDAYCLEFYPDNWVLRACHERAAFYGLMIVKQLLRQKHFPENGTITDAADFEYRIIHVDLKRVGWNPDY